MASIKSENNIPKKKPSDWLDQVVNRIIFPAGLDSNQDPLLVLCASRLPPSGKSLDSVDFTLLVGRALKHISPITSTGPYSVIIFASPSHHGPGLKQIISSYTLLDRSIRKNLKHLWIVHPSFWSKITLQIFLNGIVSWKMANKLKWINDLSHLARELPIHQICIPPEVYKFDLRFAPTIILPVSRRTDPVFQTRLEDLMGKNGEKGLPLVVRDCVDCIRSTGLGSEGLFRRPPSSITLRILQDAYDRGNPVILSDYADAAYLSASLLKLFLRSLPQPLFSQDQLDLIKACPQILPHSIHVDSTISTSDTCFEAVQYIKGVIVDSLQSRAAFVLLSYVLNLCHDLALCSERNKMDAHNLATCLAPTLLRSEDLIADAMMCQVPMGGTHVIHLSFPSRKCPTEFDHVPTTFGSVLKLMISYYPVIFEPQDSDLRHPTPQKISTLSSCSQSTDDAVFTTPG